MDSKEHGPRVVTSDLRVLDDNMPEPQPAHRTSDLSKYPIVESVEIDQDSQTGEKKAPSKTKARLEPILMRIGPLVGLFCILVTICSTFASLAVLVTSNGSATSKWPITPSVFLGIITAIGNQSMRYACVQGIIIAWWVRAQRGSTVAKLQREWLAGHSISGALRACKPISLLAVASIASFLVAIDGPLLQSASKVISAPFEDNNIPLKVNLAPEIPTGYTGWYAIVNQSTLGVCDGIFGLEIPTASGWESNNHCTALKKSMLEFIPTFGSHTARKGVVEGCPGGTCFATVTAPAFHVSECASKEISVDYNKPWKVTYDNTSRILPRMSFVIDLDLLIGSREDLNFITAFATVEDCKGLLNLTTCTLQSAVGRYNVSITNDMVSLVSPVRPSIVAIANNTKIPPNTGLSSQPREIDSTLAGLVDFFGDQYTGLFEVPGNAPIMSSTSGPFLQFLDFQDGECPSFSDPWQPTFELLNTIMFQIGAFAAQDPGHPNLKANIDPGLEIETTVLGKAVGQHNTFETNYWFFLGAALLEVVCIACILPVYWGWWRLGRAYSFSPFEIAAAFEAPILAGSGRRASANEIAREHGDRRIRYGVVSGTSSRMAFLDANQEG